MFRLWRLNMLSSFYRVPSHLMFGIAGNLRSSRRWYESDAFRDVLLAKTLRSPKVPDSGYLKCTIFDKDGNIICHGKEFKRLEFMKQHNLVSRDFRKISRHHSPTSRINVDIVPSIMTRTGGILLTFLNIRALIKHDMVVIFDSFTGPRDRNVSQSQGLFLEDLNRRLKTVSDLELPYEFRALEAILVDVTANLSTESKVHSTVLHNILSSLDSSIDRVKLRYLLIQSKKITQFHQKARLVRDLLDDVLEQDDLLNELYLTDAYNGKPRTGTNHAEVEMLLESYYKTSDEIVQRVENLISQIKTSEEIINIVLDSNRNELMLLGLKFTTGLLSMALALYVASVYGMNLENFIEEENGSFSIVVVGSCIVFLMLLAVALKKLNKVQKITMTGVDRKHIREPGS